MQLFSRTIENIIEEMKPFVKFMKEEERLYAIVEPLCHWFQEGHRKLAWRENPIPYWVWISEIMLQQTRVEAVKPYFNRFMERLPNIDELAQVSDEELLKLWEGLGYYSRARNLKKAAILCVEQYNGQLPDSYEELLKLPGIGTYTAGAIASIAFGRSVPAVDGNVLRVISRVLASTEDIANPKVKKNIEQALQNMMLELEEEKKLHSFEPGIFNQSLMELGATVCIPNGTPLCDRCPLKELCLARQMQKTDIIPFKAPKKQRRVEDRTVFLVKVEDKFLIGKRPEKGLLAGLYELPNIEGHLNAEEVKAFWKSEISMEPLAIQEIGQAKHIFSHIQWNMIGYEIVFSPEIFQTNIEEQWIWVTSEQLKNQYSLPRAFKAFGRF